MTCTTLQSFARWTTLAAMFAAALIGAALSGESADAQAALPAEVAAYIDRRLGCNHWQGEDAYDAERGRDIARALKELDCRHIDRDEVRLRRRHGRSPRVLKAMDDVRHREG